MQIYYLNLQVQSQMSKNNQKMSVYSKHMKTSSISEKGQQLDNLKTYEQNPSTLESSSITPIEPYFNIKAQQENEEKIRKLESKCYQKEIQIEGLKKELKSEQQRCKQEKNKAEKSEEQVKRTKIQLQRTKYQMDQYINKVLKYQEKNNKLKAYVREQSYQYKNLVSKHQNQKIHRQTEKDFEVETLRKILNFYESLNEGQINPQKINQFIQGQQHDIQILLDIIVEKQEAYNNRIMVLEQQRKKQESQNDLKQSVCHKIEFNLKAINQEDNKLYEICMEVNSENLRLRQNLEEMRKFVQPLKNSQQIVEEYVKKLEGIILQYTSEITNSKTQEKAPSVNHHQSQLLQAKIAELQAQLEQAKSQINQLKQCQLKTKRLEHSQRQLMAQFSEYKSHSQKQAESIQENLADIEKYNAQLNAQREKVEALHKQIENVKSLNSKDKFNYKLVSSEILIDLRHAKDLIVEQIQAFQKKEIRKSELVFREDKYHHSFGNYLTESFPLLLLVQINQNTLFGAYSSYFLADGNSKDSFLFTFDKNGKLRTYFKHQGRESSKSISYSENSLSFGYNEVRLSNNSKNYEMNIATNIFGARHYDLPSKLTEFYGMINNNKISYRNMEIHKIRY